MVIYIILLDLLFFKKLFLACPIALYNQKYIWTANFDN
jgi:hypothetical protein